MTERKAANLMSRDPQWLTDLVAAEPRVPLAAPYMAYLLLMMLTGLFPDSGIFGHLAIALHIAAAGMVTWMLRRHWPPLGKPFVMTAVITGLLAALLWVAGQHLLHAVVIHGQNLGGKLSFGMEWPFIRLEPQTVRDVSRHYTHAADFQTHVVLKMMRAVTIVPIVEELFWRGFILRAFVNWDRFDQVPRGTFTWTAFLGSSLLSVFQHPANWGVSIACWMIFNGLFYWRKSLLCLILTHAVTNLALYSYVVGTGDWQFW